MRSENNRKGFTLVELIVVLVILAILAAILVPALTKYVDESHLKICESNKSQLLREIQEHSTYEQRGIKGNAEFTATELQQISDSSEFSCPQGGHYTVTRGSDGSIIIRCSEHDTTYSFNLNQALGSVLESSTTVRDYILGKARTVDSTSGTGVAYNTINDALLKAGFDSKAEGVETWSLQVRNSSGDYYFYWTDQSIEDKQIGDTVKVLRYNSFRGTYTAGYLTIRQTTNNASSTTDGIANTYNILSHSESDWVEYTGDGVAQSDADKKDYDKIYSYFTGQPVSLS